jgi:hypothetical protein
MEAAALQLETPAELDYALRLCERWGTDSRATIAASRILEASGNTAEFRSIVPRLRALISANPPQANTLRAALIAAADDGLPQIDRAALARDSGLLTDWRVAGPFGRFANVAFEKSWPVERDALAAADYDGRTVETFRFDNGTFRLPDYFSPDGVLYAASRLTLTNAETRILRVESPGTLAVQVDGQIVLTKDDRLQATPETVSTPLRLTAGPHDIVVKFITSAVPFRVAVVPQPRTDDDKPYAASDVERAYVSASERFWAGDYDTALSDFTALRSEHDSAAVEYMLARTQAQLDNAGERETALAATLKLASSADAAAHDVASIDLERNRANDALLRARKLASVHLRVSDAQELFAAAAMQTVSPDAKRAITAEIELHPSCTLLSEAAHYLTAIHDQQSAEAVAAKLDHCAPDSLAFAKHLSEGGNHQQAARAALSVAYANSSNRQTLALAVQELMLAGDLGQAKKVAADLVLLAPDSRPYAGLLAQASDPAADPFASAQEFYRSLRRDGLTIVRQTSERRYSGGPSVTLLYDRVLQFDQDGGATVYVHKVTRVLDRDGIEQEGEVTLPLGADVLALRTIKPDLTTAEPEFNTHKTSVSMPALAAGDAIDAEYVFRVTDLNARPDVLQFDFGSFTAPIVYARFAVMTRVGQELRVFSSKDAPIVGTSREGNTVTEMWQANDIAQTPRETSSAPDAFPFVRLSSYANWTEVRDLFRDALIDAVHPGAEVERVASPLKRADDEQTAHAIYDYLKTKVRSSDTAFSTATLANAESTLSRLSGSRTVAAIAIARALGIKADLLLTRSVARAALLPSPNVYSRPLVVFTTSDGRKLVLDFETEGLAFGALPPVITRDEALYVPLNDEHTGPMASVPGSFLGEESVATGDITINSAGDLAARVVIHMASWRAMQMREVLAGIAPAERPHFFEQLATRIFPGASSTRGDVRHEHDTDQQLEIEFTTQSPAFLNVQGRNVDLDQLVPALGLRKMYAVDSPRALPLYVDTPLIERATFRIHLPSDLTVYANASDLKVHGAFGDYSVTFRTLSPGIIEVSRAFRVPVQVIPADYFGAFADFARQIDDAERQRITLAHVPVAASARQ